MKKRRLYVTPQTKMIQCLPMMLMTSRDPSKIYFAKRPDGPKIYDPEATEQDNIANWEDGEDIVFDFEE